MLLNLKQVIVPAAGEIYFARLDQNVWPLHFDSKVTWRSKNHFLPNLVFGAVSQKLLKTASTNKHYHRKMIIGWCSFEQLLTDSPACQIFVRNGFLTFIWPWDQGAQVKPFGRVGRNKYTCGSDYNWYLMGGQGILLFTPIPREELTIAVTMLNFLLSGLDITTYKWNPL